MRLLLVLLLLPLGILYAQSDHNQAKPIRIACGASIADQPEPLLIIDGGIVPYQHLLKLSPEEIKEITVIKGEVAAALYGTHGKERGVILVITKTGKSLLPEFSINAKHLPPCCWQEVIAAYLPPNHKVHYRYNGKRMGSKAFATLPLQQLSYFHIYLNTDKKRGGSKKKRVVVTCW